MAAGEGCHLYERVWVNLVRERRARVGKGAGESDRGGVSLFAMGLSVLYRYVGRIAWHCFGVENCL